MELVAFGICQGRLYILSVDSGKLIAINPSPQDHSWAESRLGLDCCLCSGLKLGAL